jgi:hypothetical protein
MKIVELKIDDSMLSGFEATALVESPAIEQDFIAFNKVNMADMTYNDYPQAAVDAAKRGIELNIANKMKCATQVGKVRAQQLVNGENLSLDTIQRMRSFLIRQKGNYELATKRKDYNACGYISYLLWGGEAALPWAEKKLRQSGMKFEFETVNNEGLLENAVDFSLYENVSFDYDGVLTTAAGKALAREEIAKGNHVYIISARDTKESMLDVANELGIPDQNVYATGNNNVKVQKVKLLNIDRHYDDNSDVINKIVGIGHKFNAEAFIAEHLIKQEMEINVAMLPNFINEASAGKKKYFETEDVLPPLLELKKNKFATQLAEKQMLVGPLMTPGKLIPRIDEVTGEEYNVFFSADTIERIAYKMMQDKLLDNVNIEHDGNQTVEDVNLVETWIVKDPLHDKSTLYGFSPVVGEWYGIYRVGNGRVWNEYVKTGKVKGFSVEGYFINNILTNK